MSKHTSTLGSPEQLRDPDFFPPIAQAIPLGIQHVLAMFIANVTPPIIIAGAAGFGFGSPNADIPALTYMIQMAMFFAGLTTLLQTLSLGPIGARLPIVQGTSFAFIPVMIPAVAGAGVAGLSGLMGGILIGGLFQASLGLFIGRLRFALPPMVTGLIVLMIGLSLISVGIEYAAGGAGEFNRAKPEWGGLANWLQALTVVFVTLIIKFTFRGFVSMAAVLFGLIAGYLVAWAMGDVDFSKIANASLFAVPSPFKFGISFEPTIIIGLCLMAFVSAIETVGDVSGITKGGAGREATNREISGATYADGLGTTLAGLFGALPNTSFSQNVGLVAMTGIMSRHVVTIGAIFLMLCGLVPKVGAVINTIPISVLGGAVIVMFGMVVASGAKMLSDVNWNRRNMIIFAISLSIGLGFLQVPDAVEKAGPLVKNLLATGLLPSAFLAIVLNLILPDDLGEDTRDDV